MYILYKHHILAKGCSAFEQNIEHTAQNISVVVQSTNLQLEHLYHGLQNN